MLRGEAAWLAAQLERLPAQELSPLLSIGSGDAALRATQPWIQRLVYGPLADRGVRVLHHELHPAPGVDVAGDLTDTRFLESLAELRARSILCCNVLEHVPDPAVVAVAIERAVPQGGYVVVTVPRWYPYHPGPIDTMFRPNADELRRLFPALSAEREAEIRCESLIGYFLASPTKWSSLAHGFRFARRGHSHARRLPLRETARMLLSSTSVSAVILRRQ